MRPRRTISRLWSLAGIGLLLALWEAGHRAYGPIVLPGLDDTAVALLAMLRDGSRSTMSWGASSCRSQGVYTLLNPVGD